MVYACSICAEESTRICVWCTKDACDNHLCDRCKRCSDCCQCEVALAEPPHEAARSVLLHRSASSCNEAEPDSVPPPPVPSLSLNRRLFRGLNPIQRQ